MLIEESVRGSVVSALVVKVESTLVYNIGSGVQFLCCSFLRLALLVFAVLGTIMVVIIAVDQSSGLLVCYCFQKNYKASGGAFDVDRRNPASASSPVIDPYYSLLSPFRDVLFSSYSLNICILVSQFMLLILLF